MREKAGVSYQAHASKEAVLALGYERHKRAEAIRKQKMERKSATAERSTAATLHKLRKPGRRCHERTGSSVVGGLPAPE